jgi:hypothetical protein
MEKWNESIKEVGKDYKNTTLANPNFVRAVRAHYRQKNLATVARRVSKKRSPRTSKKKTGRANRKLSR